MERYAGSLLGRIALCFDDGAAYVPTDLSAAARAPDGSLVVAADERACLEVLTPGRNPLRFEQRSRHGLEGALGMEQGDELDIEGLDFGPDGRSLLVLGSHSAKRKKPKGKSAKRDLSRLATVTAEPLRRVLLRTSIQRGHRKDALGPVACLPSEGDGSLLDVLSGDPHLGAFLPTVEHPQVVPGKDNGFDIEGLCCFDGHLLLGLRGPVLRGWAFVLQVLPVESTPRTLELRDVGKERYVKHALDLDGLGVRELVTLGDDVLIMAGPTMTLDGVHRLYRWYGGPRKRTHGLVRQKKGVLEPLFEVPFLPGRDRAEGLALHSWFEPNDSLLVLHDNPSEARRLRERCVLADVFAL